MAILHTLLVSEDSGDCLEEKVIMEQETCNFLHKETCFWHLFTFGIEL